jgi:hypothetical protein
MDGHMSVASEKGIGTAINLIFPLSACGDSPLVHHEVNLDLLLGGDYLEPPTEEQAKQQQLHACRVSEAKQ